jgi:deoxyribodipyrimidine photo-lyase
MFKKKIERDSAVHACLQTPEKITTPAIDNAGDLPTLDQLGLEEPLDDPRATFSFTGGETEALKQLDSYLQTSLLNGQKNSKNSNDQYSRLSPWLAFGCISPRQVYWEVLKHGHNHNSPLILDLLWRDYFRFMFKKHGMQFFKPEGFKTEKPTVAIDEEVLFDLWKNGRTGVPYIDACIHELNATGYIDNYKRRMVASYLINELHVDWTKGASYFEERLIDYSPASNWGNWAFIAGVGSDPRENKYFSSIKSSADLENKSEFIDTWLTDNTVLQASAI